MNDHIEADDCPICRQVAAIERIADTLDDYMDLSLAGGAAARAVQAADPVAAAMLQPMTDALTEIAERRAARRKETS